MRIIKNLKSDKSKDIILTIKEQFVEKREELEDNQIEKPHYINVTGSPTRVRSEEIIIICIVLKNTKNPKDPKIYRESY